MTNKNGKVKQISLIKKMELSKSVSLSLSLPRVNDDDNHHDDDGTQCCFVETDAISINHLKSI